MKVLMHKKTNKVDSELMAELALNKIIQQLRVTEQRCI